MSEGFILRLELGKKWNGRRVCRFVHFGSLNEVRSLVRRLKSFATRLGGHSYTSKEYNHLDLSFEYPKQTAQAKRFLEYCEKLDIGIDNKIKAGIVYPDFTLINKTIAVRGLTKEIAQGMKNQITRIYVAASIWESLSK